MLFGVSYIDMMLEDSILLPNESMTSNCEYSMKVDYMYLLL